MASNAEIHVIHTSINKNLRVKKYYLKKVGGVGREAGGGDDGPPFSFHRKILRTSV